ncbi:hypothetical protein [Povalibacter sp.]|uniref:hypothetical protein n=1 Tax=Povalibacter sp. TaxID=1962978 RepID=UPI002F420BF2
MNTAVSHNMGRKMGFAVTALATGVAAVLGTASAEGLREGDSALKNGRIGYVLTTKNWGVYQNADNSECPQGFNDGPREQFKKLFPEGKKRSIVEAQLAREGEQWHPTTQPESLKFLEAGGKVTYGLNLDGKIGPEDFSSPEGEPGVDNQLFRAIGCIGHYRVDGTIHHFENLFMRSYDDMRIVLELSDVDNLKNDDDVTVTTYRGSDGLLQDATGEGFIPGGTQRIDMRFGKDYIYSMKGKIVDGVLKTQPADRVMLPWASTFGATGHHVIRGFQLQLNLDTKTATGLMAGYVDVNAFRHQLNTTWSTHHHSYGQLSSPSLYKAMSRLADGYPDPKTGKNTAISSAITVKFVQTYVVHPEEEKQLVVKK